MRKLAIPLTVAAVLLLLAVYIIATSPIVSAQASPVTATVNLNYLTVQVTYQSEVTPGQTITAQVQATAKSSFYLVALTAQVFYGDGSTIRQLVTKTLASNAPFGAGKSISGDVSITVPQDAPRTSLVAAFSENVRIASSHSSAYYSYYYPGYIYYYYPYGNYTYYYCYGYGCSYSSRYNSYYTYTGYPSYFYSYTTDVGITSMPYIKAVTPEQQSLQSQNQQLQQQLNQSQANNQQLQVDNQRLQQQLQDAQHTIDQQNSTNTDLNQQLTSNKNLTYGLGGLAALFAILAAYFRGGRGKASYPPGQYSQQQHAETQGQTQPTSRRESGAAP